MFFAVKRAYPPRYCANSLHCSKMAAKYYPGEYFFMEKTTSHVLHANLLWYCANATNCSKMVSLTALDRTTFLVQHAELCQWLVQCSDGAVDQHFRFAG